MPYAKLFRSRWSALLWAGGILWMAVDVAGFSDPKEPPASNNATAATNIDVTGTPVDGNDLAIFANVMHGG